MNFQVKNVEPLENYLLKLFFENNEIRIFDVKPYLERGVFQKLKNEKLFKEVRISFDTIEWPSKIDIDPETLYEDSVPI